MMDLEISNRFDALETMIREANARADADRKEASERAEANRKEASERAEANRKEAGERAEANRKEAIAHSNALMQASIERAARQQERSDDEIRQNRALVEDLERKLVAFGDKQDALAERFDRFESRFEDLSTKVGTLEMTLDVSSRRTDKRLERIEKHLGLNGTPASHKAAARKRPTKRRIKRTAR